MQLPTHISARKRRQVAEHVHEGLGSASPPYVSIKGGMFTLVDSANQKEGVETNYLDCVIIATGVPRSRVYWGRDFDPTDDNYSAPVCFSDNMIGASSQATQPQSALCQTCPQAAWGSAMSKLTGKGIPACSVIKKVAVLVYTNGQANNDGIYQGQLAQNVEGKPYPPFLLRIPVGSHENLKNYSNMFKSQEFDVSDVVTRISFDRDSNRISILKFEAKAYIDQAADALVEKILESKATDALVGIGDVPIKGEPQAAIAAPSVLPAAPPPPPPSPFGGQPEIKAPVEPPKSKGGRPRKTAAPPPIQEAPVSAPFARAQSEAAPPQPVSPPFLQAQTHAQHGIVEDAGAPPEEVERTLADIFK